MIVMVDKRYDKSTTSFLFSFLGVFLAFASGGLVGGFLFSGLSFGFLLGSLLLDDFFVLLDGFGVHLDGGVAESAVVSVPVLSHEDTGSAGGAGLSVLGDLSLF